MDRSGEGEELEVREVNYKLQTKDYQPAAGSPWPAALSRKNGQHALTVYVFDFWLRAAGLMLPAAGW